MKKEVFITKEYTGANDFHYCAYETADASYVDIIAGTKKRIIELISKNKEFVYRGKCYN